MDANGEKVMAENHWTFDPETGATNETETVFEYDSSGNPTTKAVYTTTTGTIAVGGDTETDPTFAIATTKAGSIYTRNTDGTWKNIANLNSQTGESADGQNMQRQTVTTYETIDPDTGQMVQRKMLPDGSTAGVKLINSGNTEMDYRVLNAVHTGDNIDASLGVGGNTRSLTMEEVDNSELAKAHKECNAVYGYFITESIIIYNANNKCDKGFERLKARRENGQKDFYLMMRGGKKKDDRSFFESGTVTLGGQTWALARVVLPEGQNSGIKLLDFFKYDFNGDKDPLAHMVSQLKSDRLFMAIEVVDMQCSYLKGIGSSKAKSTCDLKASLRN